MKKKWFFGITMLVLCISALAVGVFSAQKASLTVGATVGFNASNCSVNLKCEINGFADSNGLKTSKTFEQNILASNSDSSGSLDFGFINFYRSGSGVDGIDPIEIVLTITNLSDDPSECTITVADVAEDLLMTCGIYDNFLPYTFQLVSGESLSFTITYKLKTEPVSASQLLKTSISLSLSDYTVPTLTELEEEGYVILDDEMPVLLGVPAWTSGSSTTIFLPKLYKDSSETIKEFYALGSGNSSLENIGGYEYICVPNGVKLIAGNAFEECSKIDGICLPDTVIEINENAFKNTDSSLIVNVPKNIQTIETYAYCSTTIYNLGYTLYGKYVEKYPSLSGLENLETIVEYAFQFGRGLTYIDLSASTKLTNVTGFDYSDVQNVILPDGLERVGLEAFACCYYLPTIDLPSSVTSIEVCAFIGCLEITSISLPNSITSIGLSAFRRCSGLTSITIPANCTEIGNNAFNNCTALTSITLPDGLKTIGNYAFCGCTSLTSLTIPNSVTSIGYCVIDGCAKLATLSIPYAGSSPALLTDDEINPEEINSTTLATLRKETLHWLFSDDSQYNTDEYIACAINMGNGYTIGSYVPKTLKTLYITNAVRLGAYSIGCFVPLEKVYINKECKQILKKAFTWCLNLQYVNLDNVLHISSQAFSNNTNLGTLFLNGEVVSVRPDSFIEFPDTFKLIYLGDWVASEYNSNRPAFINDTSTSDPDETSFLNRVYYHAFNSIKHNYWRVSEDGTYVAYLYNSSTNSYTSSPFIFLFYVGVPR